MLPFRWFLLSAGVLLLTISVARAADPFPEGSVWEGTRKMMHTDGNGKMHTQTTDVRIKITKRKGDHFDGEWWQNSGKDRMKIEGTVNTGAYVTIKFDKVLKGDFANNVVGNIKIGGQITNQHIKGTMSIPGTDRHGTWEVSQKKP